MSFLDLIEYAAYIVLRERNTGVQFSSERTNTERNIQAVQDEEIGVIISTSPLNMSTVHDTIINEIIMPELVCLDVEL